MELCIPTFLLFDDNSSMLLLIYDAKGAESFSIRVLLEKKKRKIQVKHDRFIHKIVTLTYLAGMHDYLLTKICKNAVSFHFCSDAAVN